MCGIWFSLSTSGFAYPSEETSELIQQRGPDSYRVHTVKHPVQENNAYLTFASAVLSLRGDLHAQPLVDEASGSVLCWNGEAWAVSGERVQGNDTEVVFQLFLQAVRDADADTSVQRLADAISDVSGPFAFVFYDAFHGRVFFSRDCLGRRSLLRRVDADGQRMTICSLWDGASFEEVDTQGVYLVDLVDATSVRIVLWADLVRIFCLYKYITNSVFRTDRKTLSRQ